MNFASDRTFRPRLEALDDRLLLSGFRSLYFPSLRLAPGGAVGGSGTPAAVHTIVNPANAATHSVAIVPHHISLGGFDRPSPITVGGIDQGIIKPGLPGASTSISDPGLTTPGLPSYPPSHPATPLPFQVGGFRLAPNGTISGSLFG
jgi:hypothetical protein